MDDSISDLSMGILRDVVSASDHKELANTEGISKELFKALSQQAIDWGVDFLQFQQEGW